MSDKVIVSKSKLTSLADTAREKTGTTDNYTLDAVNEIFKKCVNENSIYSELNEMTFGAGYMLILNVPSEGLNSDVINNDLYTYSIDGGSTYNQFTSETMTLENVSQVKFRNSGSGYLYLSVGSSINGSDIVEQFVGDSSNVELTADSNWYITIIAAGGSN